jgi:hypothetical protein
MSPRMTSHGHRLGLLTHHVFTHSQKFDEAVSVHSRHTVLQVLRMHYSLLLDPFLTDGHFSTMSDNDPLVLETEKRRNLQNVQHKTSTPHEHAPGWNEDLATVSEAVLKVREVSSLCLVG